MLTLDSKTLSHGSCLGEPLGGFWDVGCHFVVVSYFIFDLHFVVVLHFVSRLIYHVTSTPPWLLRPVKASTSSELYPNYFWLPFLFHLLRALKWAFFTHRRFLPYAPSRHFWNNLLLSRFHWEPAVTFLKVAGLHTDPRNTDPAHLFVWFTVIHNLLYILNLYLYMSILQKFYLWWKLW